MKVLSATTQAARRFVRKTRACGEFEIANSYRLLRDI
jgi:hypothetical protein